MGLVEVAPGVRLDVTDIGDGEVVLFVPGIGMTHQVLERQLRVVAESGRRAVCVDQRGHGRSDKPFRGYGLDQLSQDLGRVLELLDLGDVTLVGWSLGAQVALHRVLEDDTRVARLVLVSSNGVAAARTPDFPFGTPGDQLLPPLVAGEHADRLAARRAAIQSTFGGPPVPEVVDWLVRISLEMPSWSSMALSETLLRSCTAVRVERLTTPVLQVLGSRDPVLSHRGAAWLKARVPSLRTVLLEGCGHYPMLEAPDAFDEALLNFLPPHSARRPPAGPGRRGPAASSSAAAGGARRLA